MNPEIAQQRIAEVQSAYQKWQELYPQLERALGALIESVGLMDKMKDFYFGGEYVEVRQLLAHHQMNLDLTTSGEYSVMSEDTIWNAVHEQQTLLWKLLRTTVKALDGENDGAD